MVDPPMEPNYRPHQDPLPTPPPPQQQKPALVNEIPHSRHPLPSQPISRHLTSSGSTNAPANISRTLPIAQSYALPYTSHNRQRSPLEGPFATQECTHTKYKSLHELLMEILPRQVYLCILLGLPTLYSTRVTRLFKDAETNIPDIKIAQETPEHTNEDNEVAPTTFEPSTVLPLYTNLKYTWVSFIDSLMREYKTFNLISVLLFSAVLAILQIESAAGDPLTRFSALLSLICALISFLYGCIYIIRFGSMRKTHKAEEWAIEAQKTKASIFWNVWVFLAMPSIWLAWSILFFMVGILSFVWRTGTTASDNSPPIITARDVLGPRIAITTVFGLGITYSICIFTTFRRYANAMDEAQTTNHVAPPTSRGAQLVDQQTRQIHPPPLPLRPRRHGSYKAPEISNISSPSTVRSRGYSGVNTPTTRPSDSICSSS